MEPQESMFKVFLSGTFRELVDYRNAGYDVLRDLTVTLPIIPIGMEQYPARSTSVNDSSLDMVNAADIYVGIFSHRYGRYTEIEYHRAFERGIPIIIFYPKSQVPLNDADQESDEHIQLRNRFFEILKQRHIIGWYESLQDFKYKLATAIHEIIHNLQKQRLYELFRLTRAKDLQLIDFKQGPHPVQDYFQRPIFTDICTHIRTAITQNAGGLIVVGRPMVGKTRMILEALKQEAPDFTLLPWRIGITEDSALIRALQTLAKKNVIVFLDDLHEMARIPSENSRILDAIQRLRASAHCVVIVGTSRPGADEDMTLREFSGLIESLGVTVLPIPAITDPTEQRKFLAFAEEVQQKDEQQKIDEHSFDGTPGSVFLGLGRRVVQLRDPAFPDAAKAVLKALALLRAGQISPITVTRVQRVTIEIAGLTTVACDTQM